MSDGPYDLKITSDMLIRAIIMEALTDKGARVVKILSGHKGMKGGMFGTASYILDDQRRVRIDNSNPDTMMFICGALVSGALNVQFANTDCGATEKALDQK